MEIVKTMNPVIQTGFFVCGDLKKIPRVMCMYIKMNIKEALFMCMKRYIHPASMSCMA